MPPSRANSVTAPGTVVLRQLAAALLTILAVSAVTFLATNIKSAQDVARSALGRHATSEQIAAFVAAHDLAAPLPARYVTWLGDFAVAATSGLMMLRAFPEFVVGVGAILVFSVLLGLLPPESATAIAFDTPGAEAAAYVLPVLTLVVVAAPFLVRLTRASAREGLTAAHTRAATLRGLARRTVIWDYGMRAAAVPVVSATGLTLVHLLGGTIVVENLFGFPGLGQALVTAVRTGDTVAVQAIAVVTAALFVAIFLLTDLFATLLHPRHRDAT